MRKGDNDTLDKWTAMEQNLKHFDFFLLRHSPHPILPQQVRPNYRFKMRFSGKFHSHLETRSSDYLSKSTCKLKPCGLSLEKPLDQRCSPGSITLCWEQLSPPTTPRTVSLLAICFISSYPIPTPNPISHPFWNLVFVGGFHLLWSEIFLLGSAINVIPPLRQPSPSPVPSLHAFHSSKMSLGR